jgi:hypothetical protein
VPVDDGDLFAGFANALLIEALIACLILAAIL